MRALRAVLPVQAFTAADRRITFLMWLSGVLQGFAQAQANATLPFVRLTLGLSEGQMGQLLAMARLGSFLALAFSAYGDRRGRRRPFLAAFALVVVANGLTALSTGGITYASLQALVRAGTAAVSILAGVLLSEHLSPAVRAYGISIYGAASSFGAGLALLALPIADLSDGAWRVLFAASSVGVVALPLLAAKLRESPIFARAPRQRVHLLSALGGVHARSFWLMAGASFLLAAFSAVGLAFTLERLVNDLGFPTPQAVAISLVGGTIGGIGFLVGGRIADAWGRRPTAVLALLMALAGGVAIYRLSEPLPLAAAFAVSGFGSFAAIPALGAHRNELFPTHLRATAVVWLNNIAVLGSASGLTAARPAIDRLGLPATVTLLGAGVLVAVMLVMLLPETRGQPLDAPATRPAR